MGRRGAAVPPGPQVDACGGGLAVVGAAPGRSARSVAKEISCLSQTGWRGLCGSAGQACAVSVAQTVAQRARPRGAAQKLESSPTPGRTVAQFCRCIHGLCAAGHRVTSPWPDWCDLCCPERPERPERQLVAQNHCGMCRPPVPPPGKHVGDARGRPTTNCWVLTRARRRWRWRTRTTRPPTTAPEPAVPTIASTLRRSRPPAARR